MIRKAFVMQVHPGFREEYERRHASLWPDLAAVLKTHGVHNYSIFLHPDTHQLFAYAEIETETEWCAIAQTEVCRRWWYFMKDLMPTNADNSPQSRSLTGSVSSRLKPATAIVTRRHWPSLAVTGRHWAWSRSVSGIEAARCSVHVPAPKHLRRNHSPVSTSPEKALFRFRAQHGERGSEKVFSVTREHLSSRYLLTTSRAAVM